MRRTEHFATVATALVLASLAIPIQSQTAPAPDPRTATPAWQKARDEAMKTPIPEWKPVKAKRFTPNLPATFAQDLAAAVAALEEIEKHTPKGAGDNDRDGPMALALLYARLGQRDAALRVLREKLPAQGAGGVDPDHSDAAIRCAILAGKFQLHTGHKPEAAALFDQAIAAFKAAKGQTQAGLSSAFDDIALAQLAAGDLEGAVSTCHQVPVHISRLVKYQADHGDMDGALETAAAIPMGPERVNAYCLLAESCERNGKLPEASQAYHSAWFALFGEETSAIGPDLRRTISGQVRTGDIAGAVQMIQPYRDLTASQLALSARQGLADGALELARGDQIAKALEAASAVPPATADTLSSLQDGDPRLTALLAVAQAQIKSGDKDAAAKTFVLALAAADALGAAAAADPAHPEPIVAQIHALCHLAGAEALAGDADAATDAAARARTAFDKAESKFDAAARSALLGEITAARILAGDIPGISAALSQRANQFDSVQAWCGAAPILLRAGRDAQSQWVFSQAAGNASRITDPAQKAQANLVIANARKELAAITRTISAASQPAAATAHGSPAAGTMPARDDPAVARSAPISLVYIPRYPDRADLQPRPAAGTPSRADAARERTLAQAYRGMERGSTTAAEKLLDTLTASPQRDELAGKLALAALDRKDYPGAMKFALKITTGTPDSANVELLGTVFERLLAAGQAAAIENSLPSLKGIWRIQGETAMALARHKAADPAGTAKWLDAATATAAGLPDADAAKLGARLWLVGVRQSLGATRGLEKETPALAQAVIKIAKSTPGPAGQAPMNILIPLAQAQCDAGDPAGTLTWIHTIEPADHQHPLLVMVAHAMVARLNDESAIHQ